MLFAANTTYTIGTAMDWTFLRHIDIGKWLLATAVLDFGLSYLDLCAVPDLKWLDGLAVLLRFL